MATAIAPILFTEAPLSIEPTSPDSILHIPTETSSLFASRKRPRLDDGPALDEESYTRRYLATESSVFFRSSGKAPRSILWRVLDERKSLELQCVDLAQDKNITQDSLLTFNLRFSSPIRHNGIAFADSKSHDALEVFVLTSSNELFTFSLRRDLLLKSTVPSPSDFDSSACFKSYTLSSFTFRHPYKLAAVSDLQLLVSLHDGSLLRLERKAGESGASWRETFLHEGGWGTSLRGLIPWKGQQTVRWGNLDLAPSTAAAIEPAPGNDHMFTVSLDHTLKAWNAKTGKVGFSIDVLGEERGEGRQQSYLINPDQRSLLKVVDVEQKPDGDAYYCVLYSPKYHQFKFWAVRDAESQEYGYRDVRSDLRLIPPLDELMDTNVWQLADFDIKPGKGWKDTQLWIRARAGIVCRTFTLTFDLLGSSDDVEYAWKHQWTSVSEGSLDIERITALPQYRRLAGPFDTATDAVALSDEWLDYLLFPARFHAEMLETALHMYRKGSNSGGSLRSNEAGVPFQERLRSAIIANVGVTRTRDGAPDIGRYMTDLTVKWKAYFGLVKHLSQRRTDSLSIALDPETGLCWSVRAEQVAPIRTCSEVEVYSLNQDLMSEQDDEWIVNSFPLADYLPDDLSLSAARLSAAAKNFRSNLSNTFDRSFAGLATVFALRDAGATFTPRSRKGDTTPLQRLYEQCEFSAEIGDDDFANLTDAVQDLGGLGQLENDVFEALLDKLWELPRGQERDHILARYGDKATIRGAQDTLIEARETLLDLLCLLVFMSQDLETDELSKGFRPLELYSSMASRLREVEVLLWMCCHMRIEQVQRRRSSGSESFRSSQSSRPLPATTILQSIFIGDWSSMTFPAESLSSLLTYWGRAWTFGASLSIEYDGVTAHIMSNLIKHQNHRLAYDFMRFLPNNSWTTYLKGRVYLAEGDYALAAAAFRHSSEDLAQSTSRKVQAMETVDTSHLLSSEQREYFNKGLPRILMHASSLFEEARLASYAADFAEEALAELEGQGEESLDSSLMEIDNRRGTRNSATMQVDLQLEEIQLLKISELKEDIVSRLFSNSLQSQRFQTAFEALVKFTNPAIKRASLTQLLQSLLQTSPSTLIDLPFPSDLTSEVDIALHSLAQKQLSSSAAPPPDAPQYHRLLYSYRVSKDDFRGAAEGLYERLQWLHSMPPDAYDEIDLDEEAGLDQEVLDTYLLLINTLACCGKEEGWILARPAKAVGGDAGGVKARRKVVTLEDVRREYQGELDRRSEIAQGRFALLGEGMEVDFA